MDIEKDVSYETLKNLSKYLEFKGVRFGTKKRRYERIMRTFNNQKNFMVKIRKEYNLSRTPVGFNKKETLDCFILYKVIKNKDFKYDETRLLWD